MQQCVHQANWQTKGPIQTTPKNLVEEFRLFFHCMPQEEQQVLSWIQETEFHTQSQFMRDSHFHTPSSDLILQEEILQTTWWRSWQREDMHSQQQPRERLSETSRRSSATSPRTSTRRCRRLPHLSDDLNEKFRSFPIQVNLRQIMHCQMDRSFLMEMRDFVLQMHCSLEWNLWDNRRNFNKKVLSGGTSMYWGLNTRMEKEMIQLAQKQWRSRSLPH